MFKKRMASLLLLGGWILLGVVADIFNHIQVSWESLASIPHLITISGMVAVIVNVVFISWKNFRSPDKVASKYLLTLGIVLLIIGGMGDTILHVMGIEDSGFLSRPTHLLILLGAALLVFNIPSKDK